MILYTAFTCKLIFDFRLMSQKNLTSLTNVLK